MIKDLTKGKPAKVILSYSIPIIIGFVFQQLYCMVDTIIVGRFVSYQALAGLGATNGLGFVVLNLSIGFTSGLGILIAQKFGAGDYKKMRQSIGTSLILCIALAIVLTAVSILFADPLLRLCGTPQDIFEFSSSYIKLIFAGLFSQIAYNIIACILRAVGDSKTPLYFLVFSSVLNVALDLLFIAVFKMGVKGAALATVLSQIVSSVLCFTYAFRAYPILRLKKEDFKASWTAVAEHIKVCAPMGLQFSIIGIGLIMLQAALNQFPSTYIAGFTAANKVQNFGALVASSLSVSIANFTGQNFGAGEHGRNRKGVMDTVLIAMICCIVSSIVMLAIPDKLTALFVGQEAEGSLTQIFYASALYMKMSALFFPFLYLLIILRSALQGIGKTFWPFMCGLFELVIRAVCSIILPHYFGYNGVVWIDALAWVGGLIIILAAYLIQMPKSSTYR